MYALVDCNNFYASCERLFQPHLNGRPVVVLSNNDGCVISRSDEAKALGIAMGTPAYMSEPSFKKNDVKVFSSNYTLYGDLSDRVIKTLAAFAPRMEVYSIDESFLDLSDLYNTDLLQLGINIRKTVLQNIGIPVCVGIAPTKTLAKMANRYAKKKYKSVGVFYAANEQLKNEMLEYTEVGDIWGVGHQYALLLKKNGFHTAKDVTHIPADWMRQNMSVVGLRMLNELNGIPSIEWEYDAKSKKNICTSRSFGKLTNDYSLIKEAVSNHAATCALKLRTQSSVCTEINVFIGTNPHKVEHKQLHHAITIRCSTPTNLTKEIIGYALKGLDIIFRPDEYLYMKCGVMVLNIMPENSVQANMFDGVHRSRDKILSKTVDLVNKSMGKDTVRMAVQRFERRYKLRAGHLSSKYTTDINQILKVRI
ncbi:Y-family DNA polymerase [Ginsengibacter hankyongi]|uniref:Y-family DNA polymerase n=1 Tax=Ginsengibacter hankyongi TaxID=2607284 RepID=A0A5J5IG73_9BACT|nr:Y-family DNA polymerase [Ginsengibacter hankyongi]KAA9037124.1 Y-family DNA polymerase [Ginsengibacter hankyongi]